MKYSYTFMDPFWIFAEVTPDECYKHVTWNICHQHIENFKEKDQYQNMKTFFCSAESKNTFHLGNMSRLHSLKS
jgi:YHS domain-containing protein